MLPIEDHRQQDPLRYRPKVLLTYELLRNTMGAHLSERNPKHEKI